MMRKNGRPVQAQVWAVAVDSAGNSYSPPDNVTDAAGRFRFTSIPYSLTGDSAHQTTDVTVFASVSDTGRSRPGNWLTGSRPGKKVVRLTGTGRLFELETNPLTLAAIGSAFFLTILIGLVQTGPHDLRMKRSRYYSLVVLSFLFTFSMVVLIAVGMGRVNEEASSGDILSLGFANVYRGTYVEGQAPEWLLSLTTPRPSGTGQLTTGFGAPLWLLLISVLGSASFTLAILVKHVKDPVNFEDEKEFCHRVEELVRHQFYILFSPLGGVIVYQLLLGAGAGAVQSSVALVMLAAGGAVNVLLDKALNAVQKALK